MREPSRNKVERFPQRVGNKKVCDRPFTAEEIERRKVEKADLAKAREFRRKKQRQARGA